MPSSTSGSDVAHANRAFVALLCALVMFCATVELAMRTALPRISALERRQDTDQRAALALPQTLPDGSIGVLVVGNSLLLEGIERERLQRAMAPRYHIDLLPIENTTYWDWYFGLRRLFAHGARPNTVVICMSATQMLSNATDDGRFAYTMMQMRDILQVASASSLNSTTTSEYFFANMSAWLGLRAGLRNAVLQKWLPHATDLAHYLAAGPGGSAPPPRLNAVALSGRLRALRDLARSGGAHFVFLVPPLLQQDAVWDEVRVSAADDGIRLLMPVSSADVTAADFADGFHLNSTGARLFTDRVAASLPGVLATTAAASEPAAASH